MTSDYQKPTDLLSASDNRAEGDVDRIVYDRFFGELDAGVLVEVGAARPDYLSVGAFFRAKGWHVLSIEPNPAYQQYYAKHGIQVLQYAVDNRDEDDIDFTVVSGEKEKYRGGTVTFESWSSLKIKKEYADLKNDLAMHNIKVKVRKLNTILETHAPYVKKIDLISIDIEGWELEALSSLNFELYKPSVLIVENLFQSSEYHKFMQDLGYVLWRFIAPNDVYVLRAMLGPTELIYSAVQSTFWIAFYRTRRFFARAWKRSQRRDSAD
jgi:FkbM family methyltransferase